MVAASIGALSLLIWLYLFFAWGHFWRIVPASRAIAPGNLLPRVAAVVPARNEADVISPVIQSLLNQDYGGPLHIYVVDDHSTDNTGAVAAQHGNAVTVISSPDLPSGWTGKMWALAQGVQKATEFSPEYFLFTDADIVHSPVSLAGLVVIAQARHLDLVSMMVKLRCESFAERALMPAFVFFFFMLYPPNWVNDPKRKTAAAAGGDILVRAEALAEMGGIATISGELIDDCALAREIKRNGAIWLGVTNDARSIRAYETFGVIGRMISRNAFYQLHHSIWLLIGTLAGLVITYLAPPLALIAGTFSNHWTALFGGLSWFLMSLSFMPMVRFYSLSPLWAASLPPVAIFYAGATVHSAVEFWFGRGGEWKGRAQDQQTPSANR